MKRLVGPAASLVALAALAAAPAPAPREPRSGPGASDVVRPQEVETALRAGGAGTDSVPTAVLDREGVTIVQIPTDYDYARFEAGGQHNVVARSLVAQSFFDNGSAPHADGYDFLVCVTDFPVTFGGDVVGIYWPVRIAELGTGQPGLDAGAAFGSPRRLQGYVDLGQRDPESLVPGSEAHRDAMTTLLHELGHRHLAYVTVPGGDLLGIDDAHWSYYLANGGSYLYGADWVETQPGTWVVQGAMQHYSALDRYLMGLIPPDDVPPVTLLAVPGGDPDRLPPEIGTTLQGATAQAVSVQDVIAQSGVRVPDHRTAQKDFRAAMVLLTYEDPALVPAAKLRALAAFGGQASSQYFFETGGLGTVDVGLSEPPPAVGTSFDVPSALSWLAAQQRADGSFEDGPFTTVRDTSEAYTALELAGPAGQPARTAAAAYLATQQPGSTDYLARLVRALGAAAPPDRVAELSSRQDPSGGFGAGARYYPNPLDTALARLALGGLESEAAGDDLAFLLASQDAGGGWPAVSMGPGRVTPTCLALVTLNQAIPRVADPAPLRTARDRAVAFLAGQQNADGGFGDSPSSLYGTALAFEALAGAEGGSPAVLDAAEQFLVTRQSTDGSVGGSVYATALALRAFGRRLLPDLVVDTVAPVSTPFGGTTVPVAVNVRNRGRGAAPASVVRLWDGDPVAGGVVIGQAATPPLSTGQSQVVQIPWSIPTAVTGLRVLHAAVDPDGAVLEASEENNRASATVDVLPADTDLLVDAVTATPDPATVGQRVDITATVRSRGGRPQPLVAVRFMAGATLLGERNVSFPGAGVQVASITYDTVMTGPLAISAVVDPANAVVEVEEGNNVGVTTLDVIESSLPNASIAGSDIFFLPPVAAAGAPVTVRVEVHNTGATAIAALGVDLFLGDPDQGGALADRAVVPVPAGSTTPVDLAFTAPQGQSQLVTVVLDGAQAVAESVETDNRAEGIVPISSPSDLSVVAADVALSPPFPRSGDVVAITATVRNLGAFPSAAGAVVRASFGPTPGTSIPPEATLGEIAPGGEAAAVFSWDTAGLSGLQTLRVAVTPVGADDPLNNEASVEVGIQDGDFFTFTPFFSPNGDGVLDEAAFGYRVDPPASVELQVTDGSGAFVRTLPDARGGGASAVVRWDGRDERGRVVPDGEYALLVTSVAAGRADERARLACEVDTNARNLLDLAPATRFLETSAVGCRFTSAGRPAYGPGETLYVPGAHLGVLGLFAVRGSVVELVYEVPPGSFTPVSAAIAPDGRHAAVVLEDGALVVVALGATPTPIATVQADPRVTPVFSHDGRRLAYLDFDRTWTVLATSSPGSPVALASVVDPTGAAWTADDASLVYGDRALRRVDVATGAIAEVLAAPTGTANGWGFPQEVGGGFLVAELACGDGCTETGAYGLIGVDGGALVPVPFPRLGVAASGHPVHGSWQARSVVIGGVGAASGTTAYQTTMTGQPGRGDLAFSPKATRLASLDALPGCSAPGGSTPMDTRSLLNGTVRLAYRLVADGLVVEIRGTAADLNLKSTRLEYVASSAPTVVRSLVPAGTTSFVDQVLASWIPPSDGLFQVRLTLEDFAGNTSTSTLNVEYARPFPLRGLVMGPRYVSPAVADGRNDELGVQFDVVQTTAYTFEILDAQDSVVRAIAGSSDPALGVVEPWDGRDGGGAFVPDGAYRVRVVVPGFPSFVLPDAIEDAHVVDNTAPAVALDVTRAEEWASAEGVPRCDRTVPLGFHFAAVGTGQATDANFESWRWSHQETKRPASIAPGAPLQFPVAPSPGGPDTRGQPVGLVARDLAGNESAATSGPYARALDGVMFGAGACVNPVYVHADPTYRFDAYQMWGGLQSGELYLELRPDLDFTVDWSWPGDAQDFRVEARRVGAPDFAEIALHELGRGATWVRVHVDRADLGDDLHLVRFLARDDLGTLHATREIRVNARREVPPPPPAGFGVHVSHEASTSCPGDPPSFDRLLTIPALPGGFTIQYLARSRGTGATTVAGVVSPSDPGYPTLRWSTDALAEGSYDVSVSGLPVDVAPGVAHIDRTAPLASVVRPLPRECAGGQPIPVQVTLVDASPRGVSRVELGLGLAPVAWDELCGPASGVSCGSPVAAQIPTETLSSGDYTLRVSFFDRPDEGGPYFCRQVLHSFYLDAAVELSDPEVLGSPFSPNGDGARDSADVRYGIAEPLTVTTTVFSGTTAVRTLESGVLHDPALGATVVLAWDGLGEGGAPLPSGTYEVEVFAVDACGTSLARRIEVELDLTPPVAALLAPAGPVEPSYVVRGTADDAHFDRFDLLLGAGVAPASFAPVGGGDAAVVNWILDEIDTAGLSGPHVLRLVAKDLAGNESQADQALDFTGTGLVTLLRVDPPIFSPNGDGRAETALVTLALAQASRATLAVVPAGGTSVLAILIDDQPLPAGQTPYTWDGSGLADGDYDLLLDATEDPQVPPVESDQERVRVTIDRIAPEVAIASPPDGGFTGAAADVVGTASDDHMQSYVVQARAPGASQFTTVATGSVSRTGEILARLSGLPDGGHELRLHAADAAENEAEVLSSFTVDTVAPAIAIVSPGDGEHASPALVPSFLVNGTIDELHLANYDVSAAPPAGPEIPLVSGTSAGAFSTLWSLPGRPDGAYRVIVRAADRAGNPATAEHDLVIDGTAPVADITSPPAGGFVGGSLPILGTAQDENLDAYALSYTRAPAAPGSLYIPIGGGTESVTGGELAAWVAIPPDGIYALRLTVRDRAGNTSAVLREVTVDTVAPGAPVLSGFASGPTYQLSWRGPEDTDLAGFELLREGVPVSASLLVERSYVDDVDPPGPVAYQVRAVDLGGKRGPLSNEVVLDGRGPEVRIGSPVPGASVAGDVRVLGRAWAGSGFESYQVLVGAGAVPATFTPVGGGSQPVLDGPLATWPTFGLAEGDYVIRLVATANGIANVAEAPVVVDNTPAEAPSLAAAVLELGGDGLADDVRLSITAAAPEADTVAFNVFRNGALITPDGIARTGTVTEHDDQDRPDGSHAYVAVAMDAAGNQSPQSAPVAVSIDARRPPVFITRPGNGSRFLGNAQVAAMSPDTDVTQVVFAWAPVGGAFTDFATDTLAPYEAIWDVTGLAQGSYELAATASDATGAGTPHVITVHLKPAAMVLTGTVDGDEASLSFTPFTGTGLASYDVLRNGATVATLGAGTLAHVEGALPDGLQGYEIVARDGASMELDRSNLLTLPVLTPTLDRRSALVSPGPSRLEGRALVDAVPQDGTVTLLGSVDGALYVETGLTAAAELGSYRFDAVPPRGELSFYRVRLTDLAGNRSKESATAVAIFEEPPAPPADLTATLEGADVRVEMTPSATPGQRGTFVLRDAVVLQPTREGAYGAASQSGGSGDPAVVFDGDPWNGSWTSGPTGGSLQAPLLDPGLLSAVLVELDPSSFGTVRLETDGPASVPVVLGSEFVFGSHVFALDPAFPADLVRIATDDPGVVVTRVAAALHDPLPPTAVQHVDVAVPAGLHTYAARAVGKWGTPSVPSDGAAVKVGAAGALTAPVLLFPASTENPQDVESAALVVSGMSEPGADVALVQDGEASGAARARGAAGATMALAMDATGALGLASDGSALLYTDLRAGKVLALRLDTYQAAPVLGGQQSSAPSTAIRTRHAAVLGTLGGATDVYVLDLADGTHRRITTDGLPKASLSMDAAGTRVAYVESSASTVVVRDVATGVETRDAVTGDAVVISGDGSRIAVATALGDLSVAEAAGTAAPVGIPGRLLAGASFAFSPDGGTLAHASDPAGGIAYGLHVTDLATMETTAAPATPAGQVALPRYSSGGGWLAYVDRRPGEELVRVVDLAGGYDVAVVAESIPAGSFATIEDLHFGKDGRLYYVLGGVVFSVEPPGRFQVETYADAGPNVFTAAATRAGDPQPSPASAPATVTVVGLDAPNLVAVDLLAAPPVPVEGEDARLTAVVENDGPRAAAGFDVEVLLRRGGTGPAESVGTLALPGLAAGDRTTVAFDLDTGGLAGQHELTLVVDGGSEVPERSEGDNTLTRTLRVAAQRGVDVETAVAPPSVMPAASLAVTVDLLNAGPDRDLDLDVTFVDASGATVAPVLHVSYPAFVYGRSETVQVSYQVPAVVPGVYEVRTRVASGGLLLDADADPVTVLDAGTLSATLRASQLVYQPGDAIRLDAAVASSAAATETETGLTAHVVVMDTATQALRYEDQRALPALPPGGSTTWALFPETAGLPAGSYLATLSVREGQEVRASATATFGLASDIDVTGDLSVTTGSGLVLLGYAIANGTGADIPGATVRVLVFDPRDGSLLLSLSEVRTLAAAGSTSGAFTVDRGSIPEGNTSAVLLVEGVSAGEPFLKELDRERLVLVDMDPPVVTPIAPAAGALVQGTAALTATARDVGSGVERVEARLDSRSGAMALGFVGGVWTATVTFGSGEEGEREATFQAFDRNGNVSQPVTIPFAVDLTPPSIVISGVAEGGLYEEDLLVDVSVTDAHPGFSLVTLNGASRVPPIEIAGDGPYTVEVIASDLAGNDSEASVSFRRDTADPEAAIASPAAGAGIVESIDVVGTADDPNLVGYTLSYHPQGDPGASTVLATGTTPVRDGLLGVFDPTPLGDGMYVIALHVVDVAGRQAHDDVTVQVIHGSLEITKSIPFDARVLVWADSGGCGWNPPSFITGVLDALQVPYEVASTTSSFRAKLRSGGFNVYVVYRPPTPNHSIYKELREAVFRGEGLVMVKDHPDAMPNLQAALGVKFNGNLNRGSNVTVEILASPIGDPAIVQAPGDAIRVTLQGAQRAATFLAGGHPALTTFGFGLGRSVLFALDLEDGEVPELAEVLGRSIGYVTPSASALAIPGGVVPVEIAVENRGAAAATYRVIETVPAGVQVLEVYGSPTATSPPTWEGSVDPGATTTLRYLARLSAEPGTHATQTDLYLFTGGSFTLHRTAFLDLVAEDGRPELYGSVLAELAALEAAYPGEANRIDKVRDRVEDAQENAGTSDNALEDVIDDLLKAADELVKVVAPTTEARARVSAVLRYEEIRWATN